jgi:hypothetical protein
MSDTTPETGSSPEPETGTSNTNEPETGPPPDQSEDLQKQLEHWKSQAKKQELRAKDNVAAAKELERLKQQSMSDAERAAAEARTDERAKVTREFGTRLAEATLRTAAVGRPLQVDALVEGTDLARFVNDDGEPDAPAIEAWLDRVAPRPGPNGLPAGPPLDLGQGTQGAPPSLNDGSLEAAVKSAFGAL